METRSSVLVSAALILLVLLGLAPTPFDSPLQAQPTARPGEVDERAVLTDVLMISHAAEITSNDEQWDARLREALRQRDSEIRNARRQRQLRERAEGELAAARRSSVEREVRFARESAAEREWRLQALAVIEEMSLSRPQFREEIAAYRSLINGLVTAATPEQQYWLGRFAAGDRREAFPILQQLEDRASAARTEAARRVAARVRHDAQRQNSEAQRALSVLALDALFRGDLTLNDAIRAWERIEKPERLDHLVLARLWTFSGNDRRAHAATLAARALLENPDVDRANRLAAFITRADELPGNRLRAMADLVRNPPAVGTPGFAPVNVPALPPDHAALLEQMAECTDSLQAFFEARNRQAAHASVMLGQDPSGTIAPASGALPPIRCEAAVTGLVALISSSNISQDLIDAYLADVLSLSLALIEAGEPAQGRSLMASATRHCGAPHDRSARSLWFRIVCPLIDLSAIEMSEGRNYSSADAEPILRQLRQIELRDFPHPQVGWAFITTLTVAAGLFEANQDWQHAMQVLDLAQLRIAEFETIPPSLAILPITRAMLRAQSAVLSQHLGDATQTMHLIETAEREFRAILAPSPSSASACQLFIFHVGDSAAWLTGTFDEEALSLLRRSAAIFEQCDELIRELQPNTLLSNPGRSVRQMQLLQLAETNEREGRWAFALSVYEEIIMITGSPDPALATRLEASLHQFAVRHAELAAFEAQDFARAEIAAERRLNLERSLNNPWGIISALSARTTAYAFLGNRTAALRDMVERNQLCATTLPPALWPDGRDRRQQLEDQVLRLGCQGLSFGISLVQHLQEEVQGWRAGRCSAATCASGSLAAALFYLGAALDFRRDFAAAREFYAESSSLLESAEGQMAQATPARDLTPYVLYRHSALPRAEASIRRRLTAWLQEAQRRRPLTIDEQRLVESRRGRPMPQSRP